jgi:RNA polymerase sigma factor (TIGR02999 family)
MRRILVDYARAYYTSKRNGNRICVSLTNMKDFGSQPDLDLMALNEALVKLQEVDPDQVRIVEFRFFAGLTIEETAEVMKISHATVEREWGTAKAFLKRELTRNGNNL